MSTFDYYYQEQATGHIDIEDVGNTCISAINDLFNEYILVVQTSLGVTKILTYGPNKVDMQDLTLPRNYNYIAFNYDVSKIEKIIDKFINDPKRAITQVSIIDKEQAFEKMIDLKELLIDDYTRSY